MEFLGDGTVERGWNSKFREVGEESGGRMFQVWREASNRLQRIGKNRVKLLSPLLPHVKPLCLRPGNPPSLCPRSASLPVPRPVSPVLLTVLSTWCTPVCPPIAPKPHSDTRPCPPIPLMTPPPLSLVISPSLIPP